jgi:hypothetical protein
MQSKMNSFQEAWGVPWQYLFVDPRFFPYEEGIESHLAISFGPNETRDMHGGFAAPTLQQGPHALGLHNVFVVNGSELNLVDQWLSSFPALPSESLESIEHYARGHLSAIPDETYRLLCTDEPMLQVLGSLAVSDRRRLEDFTPSREWG